MAVWTLITVGVAMCWIATLVFGWMLCRAAQRGDEAGGHLQVVPLTPERVQAVAQRR